MLGGFLRVVVRLRIPVFFVTLEVSVDFLLLNLIKAFRFSPWLGHFADFLGNYKVASNLSRLVRFIAFRSVSLNQVVEVLDVISAHDLPQLAIQVLEDYQFVWVCRHVVKHCLKMMLKEQVWADSMFEHLTQHCEAGSTRR